MSAPDKELHLEQLIGRGVFTRAGTTVGHIEEIRAERDGEDWVIQEYLLGSYALLERLSPGRISSGLRRVLGWRSAKRPFIIKWDKLDFSDATKPRLLCSMEELEQSQGTRRKARRPNDI